MLRMIRVTRNPFRFPDVSQVLCKKEDATTLGADAVGELKHKQVLEVQFQ
jgi:hypothetical protein